MSRNLIHWVGGLCLLLVSTSWSSNVLAADEQNQNSLPDFDFIASRLLTLTDVVLQNHIDPPTRQQMILASIRAAYRENKMAIPAGLSERVSNLSKPDEFAEYLRGLLTVFASVQDLESILTEGMLACIPDGTTLTDEDSNKIQAQLAANRYVGIGVMLSMESERKLPQIPKAFFNGPASRAGVNSGDLILEINGLSTDSKDLNQVVQELRGEDGTEITLVVCGADLTDKRSLKMTRGRVFIPTVTGIHEKSEGEWEFRIAQESDIALLKINSIGPSTLHELKQIETKLQSEGIRGIIVDLRSGGGTLHDTVMVADSFLDGGVIGHIRYLDKTVEHQAQAGSLFQDIPLAVLVGRGTSSGNVLLTAALQDNQRALVVGQPTSGQTYVRSLLPIPGRTEKITLAVAEMQRPDGTLLLAASVPIQLPLPVELQRDGGLQRPGYIVPDHFVNFDPQTENNGQLDPVVAKALEVLQTESQK